MKPLDPDDIKDRQAVVQEAKRGDSASDIAKRLNDRGVPAGKAKRWHRVKVQRVVSRMGREIEIEPKPRNEAVYRRVGDVVDRYRRRS